MELFWPENDKNRIKQRLSTCKKVEYKLNYITIKKGIINPSVPINELSKGTVLSENFEYVKFSASTIDFDSKENIKKENVNISNKINKKAIFLGVFLNQTGHFILESLSRLWILDEIKNIENYDLVFTTSEWGYGAWFDEFLELAGINNAICIYETTQYDEVIVPEPSSGIRPDFFYTEEYLETLHKMSCDIFPAKYEKVYFSRTKLNDNLIGEEEIENIFRKNGYTIMYPEKMKIKEKISIIKGCKNFAAVSGSTPLWLLFGIGNDNLEQVYILERFKLFHHTIAFAEQILSANFNYIMANFTFLPAMYGPGPCLLGPTKHLLDFFNTFNFKSIKFNSHNFSKNLINYIKKWGEMYKNKALLTGLYQEDYLLKGDIITYINILINNSFDEFIYESAIINRKFCQYNKISFLEYLRVLILEKITFGKRKQHYLNKLTRYKNFGAK